MAGCDKCQDIGTNFHPGHSDSRIRIEGSKKKRENIVGGVAGTLAQAQPTDFYDVVDGGFEKPECRTYSQTADTRDVFGDAKQIEQTDASDSVEVSRHGRTELVHVAAQSIRKYRALQHVQRQPGHILCN